MQRLLLALLILCAPFFVFSQPGAASDTIMLLEEVWIEASRKNDLSAGNPVYTPDSIAMHHLSKQNMAFLLSRQSGMFIKSYGPTALATSSMRGGSAGHTALLWNGFSLESPMNQQNDLSLLPVFFMDQVSIQHGGASALWGSGAMGGVVYMNNRAPADKGWNIMGGITGGSIGETGQHLSLGYGGENAASSLKIFNRTSQNRYRYLNTAISGSPLQVQQHAALEQRGILQENYFRIAGRHQLKLTGWWQQSYRNIPPALQQSYNGAFQDDEALRITTEWQSNFSKLIAKYRAGYFREQLLYSDSVNQESLSESNTIVQEAELRWQMAPQWIIYSGLNTRLVKASAREYHQPRSQNSFSVFASAAWQAPRGNVKTVANLRQEIIEGMNIPLVPSAGISLKPFAGFILSANVSRNYRVPSLNDRYWIPGGNPRLKPESGWSQDFTAAWEPEKKKEASFFIEKTAVTVFHRRVNNWIIWLPGETGQFWSPENIMQVQGYGMEARWAAGWKNKDITFRLDVNWDHVISRNLKAKTANDASVGKQLIYVPVNKAWSSASISFRDLTMTWSNQYMGRRFITSDNNQWLEPFYTADIFLAWSARQGNHLVEVFLSGINIWNHSYFAMASRPMPLRYFEAGLNFHLNKNK